MLIFYFRITMLIIVTLRLVPLACRPHSPEQFKKNRMHKFLFFKRNPTYFAYCNKHEICMKGPSKQKTLSLINFLRQVIWNRYEDQTSVCTTDEWHGTVSDYVHTGSKRCLFFFLTWVGWLSNFLFGKEMLHSPHFFTCQSRYDLYLYFWIRLCSFL